LSDLAPCAPRAALFEEPRLFIGFARAADILFAQRIFVRRGKSLRMS